MGKVALITGANGMDAKTLTHFLLKKDYNVILTERPNTLFDGQKHTELFQKDLGKNPNSKLELKECDISDFISVYNCINEVIQQYGRLDELFSLAALSHVAKSFRIPNSYIQTNGQSTFNILENIRVLSPETRVYVACTSEMFGGEKNGGYYNEESIFDPKSPYGISKVLSYNWANFYRQAYGLFVCNGLTFNHSNIYRHPSFFIRRVTQNAARIALGKQNKLELGFLDFYKDETYSDFCVEAFWKMLQQDTSDDYVIARGESYKGTEFLEYAFNYFNMKWQDYVVIDKSRFRPLEVPKLKGDSSKAQEKLGYRPQRMPFKDHIELMAQYDYELEKGNNPRYPNVFEMYP